MAQVSSADKEFWAKAKFIIVTENNFPTAAGLASSASGFATLVAALAQLMGVKEAFPGELTTVARQGSGSACRSLYGGFVRWDAGGKVPDWSDSKAVQVFPESHWPDMTAAILVVNAGKKAVGSTAGMQETTRTSKLFRSRPEVAQEHLELLERAIKEKNFALFGEITMRDSNQFHAVCLDTYPPIFYMDDTSRRIVRMVHAFNEAKGAVVAAYTFDAGPNAVIYSTKATEPELLRWILYFFPPAHGQALEDYCAKPALLATAGVHSQKDIDSLQQPAGHAADREVGKISKLILTKPGPGPLLQPQEASLYDPATKGPKKQN
jgi:diphosphomevalonate decarboxylase